MGVSNIAARRGAKAQRRKAVVAEKRKAEALEGSQGGQIARALGLPIRCCLLSENQFEIGMGTLILARGAAVGPVAVAAFMLDTFCLGVKDVMFRTMEGEQLKGHLELINQATPLVPVDPGYARKMLRDLVQWSASLGFDPPRDFRALEGLFGDVNLQTCDTNFVFGQNGKPFYIPGPFESPSLVRRRMGQLQAHLGTDGFDYMIALEAASIAD
jgi:hypothetical protein